MKSYSETEQKTEKDFFKGRNDDEFFATPPTLQVKRKQC